MGGRWDTRGAFFHLKKADAESIYFALVECLKEKQLEVCRIIGMGFDGANTFSGKKAGVQTRIKKIAPRALFVHCHCHLLQLACVQAANSTTEPEPADLQWSGQKLDCISTY